MAKSPRPGVWALEKSSDYGETYEPWQYFADHPSDCMKFFNTEAGNQPTRDDEVLCVTDFSGIVPLEDGEVSTDQFFLILKRFKKVFILFDLFCKWFC